MTIGIVLEETMSGWIRLDAEPVEQPFAFTIRAFTPRVFSLSTPRAFRGVVRVAGQEVPTRGVLTIRLGGPRYELDFEHPTWGPLHAEGEKRYSVHPARLAASLVTCPLTICRNGEPVGRAEVAYRDSMLAFPFRALKLVAEEDAFGGFAEPPPGVASERRG